MNHDMPTTQMVAMGFVDLDGTDYKFFRDLRLKIRAEISKHGLMLKGEHRGTHSLRQRKPKAHRLAPASRSRCVAKGSFVQCCQHALHIIDPDNFKPGVENTFLSPSYHRR